MNKLNQTQKITMNQKIFRKICRIIVRNFKLKSSLALLRRRKINCSQKIDMAYVVDKLLLKHVIFP